jgi:Na+/proline symporter
MPKIKALLCRNAAIICIPHWHYNTLVCWQRFSFCCITASSYASADSALAALTTAFCIDFLDFEKRPETERKRIKFMVHIGFSVLLFLIILLFEAINDASVVSAVFTAAGYTYGPLLGLFAFGMLTKLPVRDKFVPYVCLLSPIVCYIINRNSEAWLGGYKFGFEILILNGFLTFLGLLLLSKRKTSTEIPVATSERRM